MTWRAGDSRPTRQARAVALVAAVMVATAVSCTLAGCMSQDAAGAIERVAVAMIVFGELDCEIDGDVAFADASFAAGDGDDACAMACPGHFPQRVGLVE